MIAAVTPHSLQITFIHKQIRIFFLSSPSLPLPIAKSKSCSTCSVHIPYLPGDQYHFLLCLMLIQFTSLVLSVLKVWVLQRTAHLDGGLLEAFTAVSSRSCSCCSLSVHAIVKVSTRGAAVTASSSAVFLVYYQYIKVCK